MYTEEFVTESGIVLTLRRPNRFEVGKIEQHWLQQEPQPPGKKAETFTGEEEIPDEENATYLEQRARWIFAYVQAVFDFNLLEYVSVEVPAQCPEIERTYQNMARFGTPPPYDLKDPDDRKLAYLHHILVGPQNAALQRRLKELSGATEEEKAAAEASFPGDVEAAGDGGQGTPADGRAGQGARRKRAADRR